jgi:HEAT repeat protein
MRDATNGFTPGRGWSSGAKIASAIGALTSLVFEIWWFMEVSRHCGVVRFYEYVFGILIVGGWLIGTAIGWLIAMISRRRNARAMSILGSLVIMLVNGIMVVGSAALFYNHLAANFVFHSDKELLDILTDDSLDTQILAAHKLGERRSIEAIPLLVGLLEDDRQDINLRHNAALALGNICAPPHRGDANCDRAVTALVNTLKVREEFLPSSIARALGDIGDTRGIVPLTEFVQDSSRSVYTREDAVRALGRIGGEQARTALMMVYENSDNEDIRNIVERVLKTMNRR